MLKLIIAKKQMSCSNAVKMLILGLLIASAICWCGAEDIPLIPGDNSHYVEGVSRYIWMPNGEGVPVLVDLHEKVSDEVLRNATRNAANNQYWLYTRNNRWTPQVITHGNANTLGSFLLGRPVIVIAHGWNNNGNSEVNTIIRDAFLDKSDVNVIVLDWNQLASSLYTVAVAGVPAVGQGLGTFVSWLVSATATSWANVHLVGHSLGAHLVGNAGRQIGSLPARVTGLDPAGPQWGGNSNALRGTDGVYVESIHTDGGLLGIYDQIADVDYYPNGGRNPQPGCLLSTCSHGRAYEYFAATVTFDHLWGNFCSTDAQVSSNTCSGALLPMGNDNLQKRGSGRHRVNTGSVWPF